MEMILNEVAYENIKNEVRQNLESYGEYIDSYYEDHVVESKHYIITINNEYYGYVSLFEDDMITQLYICDIYMNNLNFIFEKLMEIKRPKSIYVSTCDKTLMLMAMEYHKKIEVQDWIFHSSGKIIVNRDKTVRNAESSDFDTIKEIDDGFFKNLKDNIANGELFIVENGKGIESVGIIEKSKIWDNVASLGIFVPKDRRGNGNGSRMIMELVKRCDENKITPIAGCFSKNIYSVNTLKKAGMLSTNRLLKVEI